MAAGYKDFVAATALAAADIEDYCELQSVMRFASASARDTALASVKTAGMFAYCTGVGLTMYDGSTWLVLVAARVEVRARRTTNISCTSGAFTDITWSTEDADVSGFIAAPATTFTVPTGLGGEYAISCRGVMASTIAARHAMSLDITSSITGAPTSIRGGSYGDDYNGVTAVLPLAAADTFKFSVLQSSGGAVNLTAAWVNVVRIGA